MRRHVKMGILAPFVSLLAVASAACTLGAAGDATDDQAQATHITPDGSDLPGRVKVVAPAGATEGGVQVDSLTGRVGDALGPLSVGAHRVQLDSVGLSSSVSADVASNATTTLAAALLGVTVAGAPSTIGIGPESRVYEAAGSGTGWISSYIQLWQKTSGGGSSTIPVASDGTAPGAVFPGHYVLRFGMFDGVTLDVTANNTYALKAWDYTSRRVARIVAPQRDLPTASCASGAYTLDGTAANQPYTTSQFTLDSQKSIEVGAISELPDASYTLKLPGVTQSVPVPLGKQGSGPLDLAIGRLDVDDVVVTQADGSKKNVRGTYQVATLILDAQGHGFAGASVMTCTPQTGTGVDLPRGKYRVTTTYSTVESGTKTTVNDVDVQ